MGAAQPRVPFAQRTTRWDISSAGTFFFFFSKGLALHIPTKGSTVGQPPIELQPLLCGGVGQIEPHHCLPSQPGTTNPASDCSFFGPGGHLNSEQARWSHICRTALSSRQRSLGDTDWAPLTKSTGAFCAALPSCHFGPCRCNKS